MAPAVLLRAAVALTGRFPALAGVDLAVAQGEVVVLEGPNGAGKTSLLRVCAGLLPVTGGEAVVLGLRPAQRPRRRAARRSGCSAMRRPLYDDLSVVENVRFAVRASGADPRRRSTAPSSASGSSAGSPHGGGEAVGRPAPARRAGRARRPHDPSLWLLDEPHAGLDAAAGRCSVTLVTEAVATGSVGPPRLARAGSARFRSPTASSCWPVVGSWRDRPGGRVVGGDRAGAPSHGAPTPAAPPHRPQRAARRSRREGGIATLRVGGGVHVA